MTFERTAKLPQGETEPEDAAPRTRLNEPILQTRTATPIHTATIDKPIANTLTPRRQKIPTSKDNNPARLEMRDRIRKHLQAKTMARINQRNTYLRQTTQNSKKAQLIHDTETNTYLNYRQLLRHPKFKDLWAKSAANEFGRLTQGLKDGRVKRTDTIKFICKDKVPDERMKDVMYRSFSCDFKPNKEEKERTRLTAGGDRINYPDDCDTPTADMILFKILANSMLSTPNAKCIIMDIKDFFLQTPMKRAEYMRLKISDIPEEVIQHYTLMSLVIHDDYVYCEITQGMYSLP